MADKLVYIPNNDSQNYSFCNLQLVVETLDTQFKETTNQNFIKVPKVVKQRYYNSIRTSVINSPMSPPSLRGRNVFRQNGKIKVFSI